MIFQLLFYRKEVILFLSKVHRVKCLFKSALPEENQIMQRCAKCILPYNYPRIRFDDNGVCNFCNNHKKREYKGGELLKKEILAHRNVTGKSKYDCAVMFSGGRDSSYLLYYLTTVLNLKVLAITIDNGFLPQETCENIKNITKLLNIDLVIKKYNCLEKCVKHNLQAWLHKPCAEMIASLCVGCRLGLAKGTYYLPQNYSISVVISGGTPFEGNQYKTNLLRIPVNSKTKASLLIGYMWQISKNIKCVSNPYCILIQWNEFVAHYGQKYNKKLRRKGHVIISPYWHHIKWDEKNIVHTIKTKLNWEKNKQTGSTWRGDCLLALLKQYFYKILLGYNEKDDSLSDLIRDGQLAREEALRRIEEEQYISEKAIECAFSKAGLNYYDYTTVLKNLSLL